MTLWIQDGNHDIDLIAVIHIGVGHHVVVALGIVAHLIIVIVWKKGVLRN